MISDSFNWNGVEFVVAKAKLGTDIKFYFGEQKHLKSFQILVDSKPIKTNAFNKTDEEKRDWVFLSPWLHWRTER